MVNRINTVPLKPRDTDVDPQAITVVFDQQRTDRLGRDDYGAYKTRFYHCYLGELAYDVEISATEAMYYRGVFHTTSESLASEFLARERAARAFREHKCSTT